MDPITLAALMMAATYVYHRWIEEKPPAPRPAGELKLPRTDDGAMIPLIYGRTRVREPILVWAGEALAVPNPSPDDPLDINAGFWQGAQFLYYTELFYTLGIGFSGINNGNGIISIYAGDVRLPDRSEYAGGPFDPIYVPTNVPPYVELGLLVGDGNFETDRRPCIIYGHEIAATEGSDYEIGGFVEFYNGNSEQRHTYDGLPFYASTVAGERMSWGGIDRSFIPGYRGQMQIFLGGVDRFRWCVGSSPQIQNYSFEVYSYPSWGVHGGTIGLEANPVDVIRDIITGTHSKLGLPNARIDSVSFLAAGLTLYAENNGYSRAIEEPTSADERIMEILKQIDAVLYEDPADGLIKIKLVRPDFDPNLVPVISVDNCEAITDFACGGWTSIINKVRVGFRNRARDYVDGSATAHNQANAVGQDGEIRELSLDYPGVCVQQNADAIASRELAFLSRPITKCRVTVDRTFLRTNPGDVVSLVWPEYGISGMFFRVANVIRGELASGKIVLWLIQDSSYIWRNEGAITDPGNGAVLPPNIGGTGGGGTSTMGDTGGTNPTHRGSPDFSFPPPATT